MSKYCYFHMIFVCVRKRAELSERNAAFLAKPMLPWCIARLGACKKARIASLSVKVIRHYRDSCAGTLGFSTAQRFQGCHLWVESDKISVAAVSSESTSPKRNKSAAEPQSIVPCVEQSTRRSACAPARQPITSRQSDLRVNQGLGCGVGRALRGGMGVGVRVLRGGEVAVAVGVGVGLGGGVTVAVAVAEGVGLGGGVIVAVGLGGGVMVGVGVGVKGVGVGVGVTGVGVGVTGGVAVGVGDGVGLGTPPGASTTTPTGEPFLKKPTVEFVKLGPWSASNRKLYNVPQRIALAF